MIEVNNQVELRVRQRESEFQKVNSSHLPRGPERLGESKRSTSILKSDNSLMELLMPELLGISAQSPTWDSRLVGYFGSLVIYVNNTLKLEVGYKYSLSDPRREKYIEELKNKHKSIKDDKSLADYVESNIDYKYRILYGTPINKEDYIKYRVALEHSHVANKIDYLDSSSKIRFYIYTEEEQIEKVKLEAKRKRSIIKAQSTIMSKDETLRDAIWAFSLIEAKGNVDKLLEDELIIELEHIATNYPDWLIDAASDNDLELKASIAKYVLKGVLYKLPASQTIVDGANKELVLGNSIPEVIEYFKNEDNSQTINSYEMKYKTLSSKNKK
jgi:hypothetical protein